MISGISQRNWEIVLRHGPKSCGDWGYVTREIFGAIPSSFKDAGEEAVPLTDDRILANALLLHPCEYISV